MNSSSLVSIIMTVKNGETNISETLNSFLNQTYANFQAIIVDDGSTDQTSNIIEKFCKLDSRFTLIKTEGVGRSKALNIALENAEGRFICNVDADDPIHPQKLEIQICAMNQNFEKNIGVLSTEVLIIFNQVAPNWKTYDLKKNLNLKIELSNDKLRYTNPVKHSTVMFDKMILKDELKYNENINKIVDYDLWLKFLAKKINFYNLNLPLSAKRIHSEQSYENKNRKKYLKDVYDLQKKFLKANNGTFKERTIIIAKYLYGILPQFLRMKLKSKKLTSRI